MSKDTKLGEGDFRNILPRFTPEALEKNQALVDLLKRIAGEKKATPAQIALAWLLHKGDDIVPIPGTKRRKYLEENVAAASITLSADEMKRLDEALRPEAISGPRYNERAMGWVDR
jgi:aryl-alcohol dehydrogenase-like predicted oxidoreductase